MISVPSLGEMEQTICMLERGTIITIYYPRRKPEQKTLMLRRETRQVNIAIFTSKVFNIITSIYSRSHEKCQFIEVKSECQIITVAYISIIIMISIIIFKKRTNCNVHQF